MYSELLHEIMDMQNKRSVNYHAVETEGRILIRQKPGMNKAATLLGIAMVVFGAYFLYLHYTGGRYNLPFGYEYCWGIACFGIVVVFFRQTQGKEATILDVPNRQIVGLRGKREVSRESFSDVRSTLIESVRYRSGAGLISAVFLIMPSGRRIVGCFRSESKSEEYLQLVNKLLEREA